MVVEGLHTAPALSALARDLGVELPITEAVCSVISGTPLPAALAMLLARAAPAGEF
jgi:glycerol-3-phosphate dehydrogenase (NAD(P)+)